MLEKECYEFFKTKKELSLPQVFHKLLKESINKWKNYERELQDVYLNLTSND